MSSAKCSATSNTLNIDIDEGNIAKIEVTGNKKVSESQIIKHLNLSTGKSYKKSEIDNAINAMRSKVPYFRKVDWEPKRSDDGLNILHINVEEGDQVSFNHDGASDFNRVHGFQFGIKGELKSNYWGSRGYTYFAYGFSSKIWNYQFGVEKTFFLNNKFSAGAEIHKITDTNDREIISDTEHVVAEFLLGEAYRDFYQREGYELSVGQSLGTFLNFGVRYRDDEYSSLEKNSDWSILNRSYRDEFKDTEKYKPENPPIDEGRMKSAIAELNFDTRNSKNDATNGVYSTFSIERAGEELGGDYDFTFYQANIRSYSRLSGNQHIFLRVKAATSDRELSSNHPRKIRIGGIGTLRGYSFKEFEGDKMALINAEYWLTGGHGIFGIFFFVDSGYAWKYNEEMRVSDMKTNVGIGMALGSLSSGGLIVNIALPVEEKERESVFSFRLNRMF